MTQELLRSQAASQVARERTRVHARKLLSVERLLCIVTFTTGTAQPKMKLLTKFEKRDLTGELN